LQSIEVQFRQRRIGKLCFDQASRKLSPNDFWLASMPAQDVLQMWDTQSGDELLTLRPLDARRDGYEAFTFSPNSRLVAIALRTGIVQIWDLYQGSMIEELTPQKQRVRWQSFHFLDDNRLLGCGSNGRRNENGLYETVSYLEQWRLDEPEGSKLLEMDKRELLGEPNACLSLDRSLLATTHQNEIVLWDMRNGKAVNSLVAKKEIGYQLAIAPNNHLIASTGRNSKLLIWDLKTGEELHPQQDRLSSSFGQLGACLPVLCQHQAQANHAGGSECSP
jgi:WD40 repeat protein